LTSSGALVLILALLMLASCSDQASDASTASEATVIEPDKATEESPPTIHPTKEPDIVPEATIVATEDAAPETTPEDSEETATPVSTDTPEPSQVETAEPTAELQSGGILEEIEAIRAEIEANVVEVRGLEPKDPFVVTLLSREELRQRIDEELLADYTAEDARNDAIVMSAFDFFSADFDLYGFTLDLLSEEIAGYYDPETDEFVLISEDDEFDVLEMLTHAHEYVHALQDQHYDLEQFDDDTLDSEASMALSALAEGDATMVQTIYLIEGYLSMEELLAALTEAMEIETPILDNAPPVLARELMFPYLEGVAFVEALYMLDGFDAVDQAWEDPPQSTEHILHPQRYLDGDAPQIVALAPLTDTLGTGWQLICEDIVGELYLGEYLDQQLESRTVEIATTGWGGDKYAIYWNDDMESIVMLLRLAWDTPADGDEFFNAYQEYPGGLYGSKSRKQSDGGLCWESDDVICLYMFDGDTIISRAPNLELAAMIAAEQLAFMGSEKA
ncbi:MAG: hypothetical protein WA996_16725, partial [Candidatus Promineifilaceae bacterium]